MNKNNDEKQNTLMGILFILVLAIVPSISRLASVSVSAVEKSLIRTSETVNDIFSYNKSIALIIFTCIILAVLFLDAVTSDDFKLFDFKRPHFILIFAFVVLALISSVFSKYKPVSFSGISERYEGFWTILCYCVLFAVSSYYVKDKCTLRFIIIGTALSAVIVGGVGFSQLIGKDIFKTEFMAKLVLGKFFKPGVKLSIKFDDVYATLYNPNCAGLFSSMLTMFFTAFAVILPMKNLFKYVSAFLAVFMLAILIGSGSASGAVGLCMGIAITACIGIAYLIKNKKLQFAIAIVILGIAVICVVSLTPSIQQKFKAFADNNPVERLDYRNWEFDGYTSSITTRSGVFQIIYDTQTKGVSLKNYDGNDAEVKDGVSYLSDRAYTITVNSDYFTIKEVNDSGTPAVFNFAITDSGLAPLSKKCKAVSENIPSFGFEGNEYFASSRGYIWSRSIPVAFKHFLIGSGCDTFAFEFPQDDVIGKIRFLGNHYVIVDKPHNMLLQIAVNTGVVSLAIFLAINVIFIIRALKTVFRSNDRLIVSALIGITGAVTSFIVTSLATDSVVSVTPVYFILLGTGFGLTSSVNKEE